MWWLWSIDWHDTHWIWIWLSLTFVSIVSGNMSLTYTMDAYFWPILPSSFCINYLDVLVLICCYQFLYAYPISIGFYLLKLFAISFPHHFQCILWCCLTPFSFGGNYLTVSLLLIISNSILSSSLHLTVTLFVPFFYQEHLTPFYPHEMVHFRKFAAVRFLILSHDGC